MTLKRIETITLFDAAWAAMAMGQPCGKTWYLDSRWSFVPAMLEWLRGRDSGYLARVNLGQWGGCGGWSAHVEGRPMHGESFGPDLPTALARLVLRVAELEGNQGGK